jgi:hypothetical protein
MAKTNEIVDSKSKITSTDASDPGFPSVKEMRDNQEKGNTGIGLNEQSYIDDLADFNQEPGSPSTADDDTTPTPSDVTPQAWLP